MIKTFIKNITGEDFFISHKTEELVGPIQNTKSLTTLYHDLVSVFESLYPSDLIQYIQSITINDTYLSFHILTIEDQNDLIKVEINDEINEIFQSFEETIKSTTGFMWGYKGEGYVRVHSLNYLNETFTAGIAQFSEKDYYQALHYMPVEELIVYEELNNCFSDSSELFIVASK